MKYAHQGNPFLTWETLSDVARYSLERCIDRVREGQPGLVSEDFDNGNCYAYACGEFVNYGINGEEGLNIFRQQRQLSETGNERKSPMPKKALKLQDWQEKVRQGQPEMFDPPPMELKETKSPLIKPKAEEISLEDRKSIWARAFGGLIGGK